MTDSVKDDGEGNRSALRPLRCDVAAYPPRKQAHIIAFLNSHFSILRILPAKFMAEKLSDGILSVHPKPSRGFSSKLLDLLERVVVKLMHDASLPLHYLSGNFAPLRDETPPVKDLPVHGFLPVSSTSLYFEYFPGLQGSD